MAEKASGASTAKGARDGIAGHDKARRVSSYAYSGGKAFDKGAPCVVFIHGALHDHSVWTLLARWFAHHGHSVLAVDQPGHGRSRGRTLPDVEALADWTLALLDAAGVERAALVGHSMGSLIALEAAARAPQRITTLVMIGTAVPMKVSDALLSTARDNPLHAIDMVNALSHASMAPEAVLSGPGRLGQRRLSRPDAPRAGGPERRQPVPPRLQLVRPLRHGLAAAAQVRCPASLILGARDQMTTPRQTREISEALKAKVIMVPAGHDLMAEAPEEVLAGLREVLV